MWKVLNRQVDLGEPTSFLDHVYLGCTPKHCETRKHIVDNHRTMFESRISAGATGKKLPSSENPDVSTWSYDMEGHAKKCMERYCELANKTTEQLHTVSTHAFFFSRIVRPNILWSANKLARAITKWTRACDKRLARLISDIHCTNEYKQFCHVGNTAQQCRSGLFQDSYFAGDLEDSKSTSSGTPCVFGSHTFVPISWMCKNQACVSHSSAEAEIISLDAGLRIDGLPALDLWDLW